VDPNNTHLSEFGIIEEGFGAPTVHLGKRVRKLLEPGSWLHVSPSCEDDYVVAVAILESEG
jgi:phosphopantetheinyl transferase (holo-ACP synthase)